jgi:hypothetical protein
VGSHLKRSGGTSHLGSHQVAAPPHLEGGPREGDLTKPRPTAGVNGTPNRIFRLTSCGSYATLELEVMVMGKEARTGVAEGPGRKASGAGWEAQPAIGRGDAHCQNGTEIGPEFVWKEQLSKIKDEPTMFMKINKLKNDKMSDATMFLNRKDLDVIEGNFIKMC